MAGITVSHLSFTYPQETVPALRDVSFSVEEGEFLTVIGPSGGGKSTLLRALKPALTPHGSFTGDISFFGEPLSALDARRQAAEIGFVLQKPDEQIVTDRVWHELAFGMESLGFATPVIRRRVAEMASFFGIEEWFSRPVEALSGGQKQLLNLASVMALQPRVLLLDEPFSALDYKLRRAMQLEIKRLQRRLGITFVFVTHDQEEAFAMSDRVVVMNQGRIEQIGTPQEIYEEPSNLYVARFVGEINILPARIMSVPGEGIYIADISGRRFTLRTSRPFAAGDRVNVLLRPEDIRVYAHDDERPEGPYLTGRIEETVYKGATVDISIALDSGETLSVAEFFNEDDAEISYNRGERVAVTWVDGWEVVLPYEAD